MRPCGRCRILQYVECIYETPVRQSKANLRTELEQLRRQQRSSDSVFAALIRSEFWEGVLQRLRRGDNVESISDWLDSALPGAGAGPSAIPPSAAPSTPLAPTWRPSRPIPAPPGSAFTPALADRPVPDSSPLSGQPPGDNSPWGVGGAGAGHFSPQSQPLPTRADLASRRHELDHQRAPVADRRHQPRPVPRRRQQQQRPRRQLALPGPGPRARDARGQRGARVEGAGERVDRHHRRRLSGAPPPGPLLLLGVSHLRLAQQGALRQGLPGRPPPLLLVHPGQRPARPGCRFSSQPNTRAVPDDPYTSGDHFFAECQRPLRPGARPPQPSPPSRPWASCPSARPAAAATRRAGTTPARASAWPSRWACTTSTTDTNDDEDELAVQSATFWGAFALDQCVSPSLPLSSPRLTWDPPSPAPGRSPPAPCPSARRSPICRQSRA